MFEHDLLQLVASLKTKHIVVARGGGFLEVPYRREDLSYLGRILTIVTGQPDVIDELIPVLAKIEEIFVKFMECKSTNSEMQQIDDVYVSQASLIAIHESESTVEDNYLDTSHTLKDEVALIRMFVRDNSAIPEIGICTKNGMEVVKPLNVKTLYSDGQRMEIEVFSDVEFFCKSLESSAIRSLFMNLFPEEAKNLLGNNFDLINRAITLMTQGAELPTYLLLQKLYLDEGDENIFSKNGINAKRRSVLEEQANGDVHLKICRAYELKNTNVTRGVLKTFDTETIFNLSRPDEKIRVKVRESFSPLAVIEGMRKMKSTLVELEIFDGAEIVNKTIYRMNRCYKIIKSLSAENITEKPVEKLRQLESSMILDATEQGCVYTDSLTYLQRKLEIFLLTRQHQLTLYQIEIVKALINEIEDNLINVFYKNKYFCLTKQDCLRIRELVERKLLRLDRLKGVAAKVGIILPSGLEYDDYQECNIVAHSAPIGCRKESGMYVINAFNAGLAALGKVSEKSNTWGKTVVEFQPVNKGNVLDFLKKSLEVANQNSDLIDAIKNYKSVFEQLVPREISGLEDRPFQRIGNCGIRNHMEWIIYTLQRLDESALANEIVFFQIIQNKTTHTKTPVKPLAIKEDDNFFII